LSKLNLLIKLFRINHPNGYSSLASLGIVCSRNYYFRDMYQHENNPRTYPHFTN